MKIAMIGQKGIPVRYGGIERHVQELSLKLNKLGHSVFVYTRPYYTNKNLKEFKGVNLISLPSIHTKHLDAISHTFLATLDALRKDYDIIHYHGVGPSLLSWIPRIFKPRVKVVVTFHCIDRRHKKWGWFARFALKVGEMAASVFPHQTIAVSKTLQEYIKKKYKRKAKYIPNGVNKLEREISREEEKNILNKFGLDSQKYILMVSRLIRHKGAHYLIEAYKGLKNKNGLKLAIIGDSSFTDDYVKELKELAKGNSEIVFTGNQMGKNLQTLFKNAYILVHPSETEGLPIVILEAMSYRLPVLASDIPENLELVKDFGFSFKSKDIRDLQEKLDQLISQPKLLKEKVGLAQKFIWENYNWENIAKKTDELYNDIVNGFKIKKPVLAVN